MVSSILPLLLLAVPLAAAVAVAVAPSGPTSSKFVEIVHVASISAVGVLALLVVGRTMAGDDVTALGNWLYVDPLAAIFVSLIGIVGFLTGLYALGYVRHEVAHGELTPAKHKIFYGFFNLFVFTMLLAVTSNNIVMMWVAVEATTLGSAFLVGLYGKRSSLEAAWKYVIICTVGVAFGLYGTILTFSNGAEVLAAPGGAIYWTTLAANAKLLDPTLVKIAFVFVLIGFGTKAGLFPMHAWLPDAHSEAPSPVSALLSGVLLKCALFVIIRYHVITMQAVGPEFSQSLLLTLGFLSVAVSAFLVYVQHDLKRKLAYHSVEHLGLIVLGLGIGGPLGIGAALLHAINHSFCKALLFCGSGNVLIKYGTRDLKSVKGLLRVAPVSGLLMMAGALALAGFPPFNIFVSEFLIFSAGVQEGHWGLMIVTALLFTITVAALIHIVSGSVLGKAPDTMVKGDVGPSMLVPMAGLLVLVLVMGVAVPQPVSRLIQQATAVVIGGDRTVPLAAPWQHPAPVAEIVAPARAEPRS
ncbi:hydrogenase 4 subunit F [Siculibacillus lacustris]|uniref:Hydrogenase 4 subunit F n=1 Tax=Siculibacillus lacustris TaxID=1549641 RepID=A0A4Q9VVM9_9HYPH|nr:hydrogenase 4 subunit F [Siculibacillus lacustris]TBW40326.1 hydrogenase 4 subunit F [Siculibacillus lacustris]